MHILIGDVHGCLDELQALWEQLPLAEARAIVFLGDLIDKGPDSDGVLDFVQAQSRQWPLVLVRGNHEAKALRAHRHGAPLEFQPTPERLALLAQMLPFYAFKAGQQHCLAVHGGLYPAFWHHESQLPDPYSESEWPRRLRDQVQRFLFCRYVNPQGHIVALGHETAGDHFWAESYAGQAGTVFFGHQPFIKGVARFARAYGLDTGCVFGGKLSAALIWPDGQLHWQQVPAQKAYAVPLNWEAPRPPQTL